MIGEGIVAGNGGGLVFVGKELMLGRGGPILLRRMSLPPDPIGISDGDGFSFRPH